MFKHMSNSISYNRPKWDLWMVAALVCVAVVLGIYPADRTVWCVEMVWAVGLLAVLLLTRRKFRFSTPAYLCFFVWTVLQLVGAHYTFEHVPMEWLMKPLGLVRNPYDRIAHFAVGWFAFPLAELFFSQELGEVRWLCRVLRRHVDCRNGRNLGACRVVVRGCRRRGGGCGVPRFAGRRMGRAEGHPLRRPRRDLLFGTLPLVR